jgi:hypothetical protein
MELDETIVFDAEQFCGRTPESQAQNVMPTIVECS